MKHHRLHSLNRREFPKSFTAACTVTAHAAASAADKAVFSLASTGGGIPVRTLGKAGVKVSALALGGVIGMQLPPSDHHDPMAFAETALNLGVTYFDTALAYNNGQSETNYGHVLVRRRYEVFLATKTGDRMHDGTRRSIEQSLRRLQTDHLDLIQIHGISQTEDIDAWDKPTGVLTALRKLREQKVTRFIGVASVEQLKANIRMVREVTPMTDAERRDLETAMG